MDLVGHIDPGFFVPLVGNREASDFSVTLPAQVYARDDIIVVLVRSPVIRARRAEFVAETKKFIEKSSLARTLLVSGTDIALRMDGDITSGSPFRQLNMPGSSYAEFTPFKNDLVYKDGLRGLGRDASLDGDSQDATEPGAPRSIIPGAGLTNELVKALRKPEVLLVYTTDGDNTLLAQDLAAHLLALVNKSASLRIPEAWSAVPVKEHEAALYVYG